MLRFSPLLLPRASRGSSTSRGGEARRQPARTSCIPETVRLHSRLALLALIHLSAWNVHSRKLYRLGGYRDGSLEVVVIVELVEGELGDVLPRDAPPLRDAVDSQNVPAAGRIIGQS